MKVLDKIVLHSNNETTSGRNRIENGSHKGLSLSKGIIRRSRQVNALKRMTFVSQVARFNVSMFFGTVGQQILHETSR